MVCLRCRGILIDEKSRHAERCGNGRCWSCLGLSVAACVSPSGGGSDRIEPRPQKNSRDCAAMEIDDVLYNPGMGFADFHFGFAILPSPMNIRDTRPWPISAGPGRSWSRAEGQYNFALIDGIIAQAKAKGRCHPHRLRVQDRHAPKWVLDKGVGSVKESDGIFPDYNNPIFDYHERSFAFGERYDASLDIDHVDIGSVGCWEWNTACCGGVEAQCKAYYPSEANQVAITDWYLKYFSGTPLVMLHGGRCNMTARGGGMAGRLLR